MWSETPLSRRPFYVAAVIQGTGLACVVLICACGSAQTSSVALPTPVASQTVSPSPVTSASTCTSESSTPPTGFATYSINRISFQYPTSWRLQPPYQGGPIFWLYSPDYKDSGGAEIQTIQQGGRLVFSQTDVPQTGVTADNYPTSNRAGYKDGSVVVINCRRAFQLRQGNPPWWDTTSTVFFRDDGTQVEVAMNYPSGQPAPHFQEYEQLLASLVY